MVRNMVGTLIEIGRGHWPPERAAEIIASGQRSMAGQTAPACGLCLQWVRYDLPACRQRDAEAAVADGDPGTVGADGIVDDDGAVEG